MRNKVTKLVILWMALCLTATSVPVQAAEFSVAGDNYYKAKTRTLLDRRFHNILRQKYDFSCGSAALASLLTYHYRRPVSEKEVIEVMYKNGDQAKIRTEGFSLLDMKNYLESTGLRANGYRQPLDQLVRVGIPAIVLINRKGYMHFVIVQGLTRDKVLIGDPALGRKVVNRKEFESMWESKILFVVDDEIKQARPTFNTAYAWNTKATRGFAMPLPNTNLATMSLFTSYSPNTFND
jgi:uncharacterized protein